MDNILKPDYYLDCGERYQPNVVANIWNLKGSMPQSLKYIKRAGLKVPNGRTPLEAEIEDLGKAISQIQNRIDYLENKFD